MIPKVIHYCWFGKGELPELALKCIDSWKRLCPDYEIKEWNESNFDLNVNDFVREAYEAKKWAFVSDYARLWIVFNYGGVYLDTDVELVKSLDELLDNKCFLGAETTGQVNTGLGFGAEKNNVVVKLLLNEYNNRHFNMSNGVYDMIPCPQKNTAPLKRMGYKYSEVTTFRTNMVTVFPPEYFCPISYQTGKINITKNTISIHHFSASWISEEAMDEADKIAKILKNNLPVIAQIKKQYYLYSRQKNKGNTNNFIYYIVSKIRLKMKL